MTLSSRSQRHWRSLGVLGLVACLCAGVAWAATRSDGRPGTESTSNDGGAWLLKRDRGAIGHLNREVLEVTAGIRITSPGSAFDVDQAPGIIAVLDQAVGRVVMIDPRTHQPSGEILVPENAKLRAVDGGIVVYRTDPLEVWKLTEGQLLEITDIDDIEPMFSSDSSGSVSASAHSDAGVVVYVSDTDTLHRFAAPGTVLTPKMASIDLVGIGLRGPVSLTSAGSTVVAATEGRLVIATATSSSRIDLPDGPVVVQQPGDDGKTAVAIESDGRLLHIDLSSGEIESSVAVAGTAHLRPIVHDGCVFAVSTEPPSFAKVCNGELLEEVPLDGAGPELRLRLVNGWVWINDIETGGAWLTNAEAELSRIDDWGAALADQQLDESDATVEDGGGIEEVRLNPDSATAELIDADQKDDDDENEPPVARDDESQTRVDRPLVVRVLDNDEDADGDVLLVSDVEIIGASNAQVWATTARDAVQVTPAAGFSGRITFTYRVTDGRGGEANAIGTVEVSAGSQENNRDPVPVTDVATARAGAPVSLNVLLNDTDPDGDTLALVDIEGDSGTLIFDPSGQITFTPDTTGTDAQIELTYVISDDYGATAEGRVLVNVRLEGANSPPDARNDSAVTSVGSPATLQALDNDTDPDDDALIVARQPTLVRAPGNQVAEATNSSGPADLTADGQFFFIPEQAGTYVFEYLISDGQNTDLAQIRVDVSEATENQPPTAVRDDVTIPIGGSRLVYALDNDGDPNGDVVGIVEWSGARGLTVEEVPGIGFRVSVQPDAPSRAVFRYAISDGEADPVATIVVISVVDVEPVNQPPVVRPDAIELRAGRSTPIPVLLNDYDPEGGALEIIRVADVLGVNAQFEIGPLRQTVVLTLDETVTENFSFGYDVADPQGASSAGTVDVRVIRPGEPNRPPVARPDTGRSTEGVAIDLAVLVNDSDPDGDGLQIESIAGQPANGSAEITEAGTIIYTPSPGFTGTDRFTYVLLDTEGERTVGSVQIGVTPEAVENRPPSANNDLFTVYAGDEDVVLDVVANDFDPDNDRLTVIGTTEPSIGTVVVRNGSIHFTPPAPTEKDEEVDAPVREVSFTYELSDGHGNSDDALVTIRIEPKPEPQAPVAVADKTAPTRGNRQLTVDVTANDIDPDGDIADLLVSSDDPAVQIVNNQMTISVGQASSQHRYTITDPDGLTASAIVTVFVVDNEAPTLAPLVVETQFETPISLTLSGQADDPDDDTLFFVCCDNAQGGVGEILASGAGTLNVRFVPSPGFDGQASFSYSVDDQAGHLVAGSATINVLPPDNRPPTAIDGSIDVEAGTTVPFDVLSLADDPDVGDTLSVTLDANPAAVTASLSGSVVTLTAAIDTAGGSDALRFSVTDSFGETASGTLTVQVVPVSAGPPQSVADSGSTNQGQAIELPVLLNDVDPLGQGLGIFQIGSTADGATAQGSTAGSIVFTPDTDFFGTTTFTYTVRDATGSAERESVGQVSIDVIGRPAQPAPPGASADNAVATIIWSTPVDNGAPVDSYRVEYTTTSGDTGSVDLGTQNSHTWTGLTNGEEYQFRLQAHNVAGWGDLSDWSALVRPDTRPDSPDAPTVAFADGELAVDWIAPSNDGSGITGYKLEIGGGTNQVTSLGAVTSHTWRSLANGTEYQFRIAAVNAAGDSDWSAWSASEHPLGAPLAPNPALATRGNQFLDIDWTAPDNNGDAITGYDIELRSTGQVVAVAGAGTTSYRWADLTNGIAQEFRVRASNRDPMPGLWSSWSAPIVPCTVPDTANAPTAARGDLTATVSWSEPYDQGCAILSYNVRANGTAVQTVGAGSTSHVFTGLTNGTGYTFEIQTVNEVGTGTWSSLSAAVTPAGPPTAPTITSASPSAADAISVTWGGATANGSPITSYELSINGGNAGSVGVVTSHTASGLLANTSYGFRVRACNTVSCGAWSGTVNATTWGPPTVPLAVSANAGDSTWWLTWSAPASNGGSPLTGYEFNFGGPSTTLSATASQYSTTAPNGQALTGYVRACNAVGCSDWVSGTATPSEPPPQTWISIGTQFTGRNCETVCNWINVSGSGFWENSLVTMVCTSSYNGSYSTSTTTADANGSFSDTPCFFGYPGHTVSVVANGVRSNTITWP
jgi:hypothetical protein